MKAAKGEFGRLFTSSVVGEKAINKMKGWDKIVETALSEKAKESKKKKKKLRKEYVPKFALTGLKEVRQLSWS